MRCGLGRCPSPEERSAPELCGRRVRSEPRCLPQRVLRGHHINNLRSSSARPRGWRSSLEVRNGKKKKKKKKKKGKKGKKKKERKSGTTAGDTARFGVWGYWGFLGFFFFRKNKYFCCCFVDALNVVSS